MIRKKSLLLFVLFISAAGLINADDPGLVIFQSPGNLNSLGTGGDHISFSANPDDNDDEIFYYDGSQIIQITDNETPDFSPAASGGRVFWLGTGSEGVAVFDYAEEKITQLTNYTSIRNLVTHNGQAAWIEAPGVVMFYDGTSVISAAEVDYAETQLAINSGNLIWHEAPATEFGSLFFWDGYTSVLLTGMGLYFDLCGTRAAWIERDPATCTYNVYQWDGSAASPVTDSGIYKRDLKMGDGMIVWIEPRGRGRADLYVYEEDTLTLVSRNYYFGRGAQTPQVADNNLLWVEQDFTTVPCSDIYLYRDGKADLVMDDLPGAYPRLDNNALVWAENSEEGMRVLTALF